jgi:hypothetical protein
MQQQQQQQQQQQDWQQNRPQEHMHQQQQQQEEDQVLHGDSVQSEHTHAEPQHSDPDHPEEEAVANGEELQGTSNHQWGPQADAYRLLPAAAAAAAEQQVTNQFSDKDEAASVAVHARTRQYSHRHSQQRSSGVVRAAAEHEQLTLDEIASVAISRLAAVAEQQQQQQHPQGQQPRMFDTHVMGQAQHEQEEGVHPLQQEGSQQQLAAAAQPTQDEEQQRPEDASSDTQADAQEQRAEDLTSDQEPSQQQLPHRAESMHADMQQHPTENSRIPSMQADADDEDDAEGQADSASVTEEQQAADPVLEQHLQDQVAAESQQLPVAAHQEAADKPDAGQGPLPQELDKSISHDEVHDEVYQADQHTQAAAQGDVQHDAASAGQLEATSTQHSQDGSGADAEASKEQLHTERTIPDGSKQAAATNNAHVHVPAVGARDVHAGVQEHGDDDPNDPNLFGAQHDHLEAAAIAAEQAQALKASQLLKLGKAANLQEASSSSSSTELKEFKLRIASVGSSLPASDASHR